jgi:hypothetical protein
MFRNSAPARELSPGSFTLRVALDVTGVPRRQSSTLVTVVRPEAPTSGCGR